MNYKWKLTQHRTPRGQQDIRVKILLDEIADGTYASYAESFGNVFMSRLRTDIPRTNIFSADLMYAVRHIDQKTVEIWKLTVKGDWKHSMYTLQLQGSGDGN